MLHSKSTLTTAILAIIFLFSITLYEVIAEEPTPYSFINNAMSPRQAGIGGAAVSFVDDAAGVFLNPAIIFINKENNFSATYYKHLLDVNSGNVSYVCHNEKYGAFAASAIYTNFGSFDYYDVNGNATGGSFSGNMIALAGSYANEITENLYGGVTAKIIYNQLENMNGVAFATDLGLLYQLNERTNIGFSVLNAGTELKQFSSTYNSKVPMDVRLGFNHRLQGLPLNFNFGFRKLTDGSITNNFGNIVVGGEIYIGEFVQLRVGFDNYIRKNLITEQSKGLSGFAAGFGVLTKYVNIDYSLSLYSSDIMLHRFGLNLEI